MIADPKQLRELGLEGAANAVEQQREIASHPLREKLRIAFEHFRVVEPRHMEAFQKKLKSRTWRNQTVRNEWGERRQRVSWYELEFTKLGNYQKVPPPEVLTALKAAQELKCFDHFVVATAVQQQVERPVPMRDPILFGLIEESENYYFIAQWEDDVRIEEILKEDEG